MTVIKKALLKTLDSLPKTVLYGLLARKAKEAGAYVPPEIMDAMAEHILSKKDGEFEWDDAPESQNKSVKLAITEEEVDIAVAKILETISEAALKASEVATDEMFKVLCERWPGEHATQLSEFVEFRNRLEVRWGEGLNYLRMLLTCCREAGQETLRRHNKSKSKRHMYRRWVLVRLHARACQVTDEIICLMENGFADGAMARWRTLYELSVVAALIADGDEDVAERYILHDAVEVKRQADEYDATQVPLGFTPINKRKRVAIELQYKIVLDRFGPTYASPYGWADLHLDLKKPTFKELQIAAGRASMSSYYKMASFNVHAGARSLFFNLSSMGDKDILPAGRSNAGLVDPGEQTAQTLALITSLYVGDTLDLDRIAELNCLLHARDAAVLSLRKANQRLLSDEQARKKKLGERRTKRASKREKLDTKKDRN